jgi:hypothetical protein
MNIKVTVEVPNADGKTKQIITGHAMQVDMNRNLSPIYSLGNADPIDIVPNTQITLTLTMVQEKIVTVQVGQVKKINRFKAALEAI